MLFLKPIKSHIKKTYRAILSVFFFSAALIYLISWNGTSGENYRNIIRSDGYGYYDYFPMLFGKNPIDKQKENGVYLLKTPEGKVVNKYFIGTALLQSPFVLSVSAIKSIFNTDIDFHSEIFQKTVSIAALFYLIIGLIFLRKLLLLYEIENHIIEFSLFSVFFGTNLLYYSILEPSMSHVYSFAAISVFLYYVKKLSIEFTARNMFLTSFIFALVILIRPINILIILVLPFILGSVSSFINLLSRIFNHIRYSYISLFIFIITLSIQLLVWKAQTGSFIVWSYANEGFYFNKPEILNFLFSFRKGLFIYSPFVLVSILIYIISGRKNRQELALSIGFIFIIIYVLSSWWNWYYGDSFGSRVFIEYLPVIVLLLAIGLKYSGIILQRISVLLLSVFILLNLMQTYQYHHNIISHFDMNSEKYFYTFGKIDSRYENILGGNDDIVSFHKQPLVCVIDKEVDFKKNKNNSLIVSSKIIDNKTIQFEKQEYGLSYFLPIDSLIRFRESYLEIENSTKLLSGNLDETFWTITYLDSTKKIYNYQKIKINAIPAYKGKQRHDIYKLRVFKPFHNNDLIMLSIWNYSKAEFELSNLKIKISGIIQ